jgi:hypothetical protein
VSATATDAALNVSSPGTGSLLVDATAPDAPTINDLITNDINITEYTKKTDSLNDLISNDIHLTEHEESSIDSLIKDNIDYNYI